MPPRNPAQMTAEERAAKVDALKPEWAKSYILQLEGITRTLAAQLAQAHASDRLAASQAGPAIRVAGITPPQGEYTTARVLDGRAGMEPLADLPEGAEILFAGFYQVHYGNHESTGGARVLIVEAGSGAPLAIHPVSPGTVLITRAG